MATVRSRRAAGTIPLTATVAITLVKRDGAGHGLRVLALDRFFVRSEDGGRWQACRMGALETPPGATAGEFSMTLPLASEPVLTPEAAARLMWRYIRDLASRPDVWLVDNDVPPKLAAGLVLMPRAQATAIREAAVAAHRPVAWVDEFFHQNDYRAEGWVRPGPERGTDFTATFRSRDDAWWFKTFAGTNAGVRELSWDNDKTFRFKFDLVEGDADEFQKVVSDANKLHGVLTPDPARFFPRASRRAAR